MRPRIQQVWDPWLKRSFYDFSVQTMNILMVYQSVLDTLASFITLMIAVVEVDNTRMSRDSIYSRCPSHKAVTWQRMGSIDLSHVARKTAALVFYFYIDLRHHLHDVRSLLCSRLSHLVQQQCKYTVSVMLYLQFFALCHLPVLVAPHETEYSQEVKFIQ